MAEGLARYFGKGALDAESAGLMPKEIHPLSISVMDEININIRTQSSKAIDSASLNQSDLVITLCDNADAHCPILPPHIRKEHWPLADPAAASGNAAEKRLAFQRTRDKIKERILRLLKQNSGAVKKR